MSYPLGPVPCNDGSEFWDSLSAPGACKGIQCHHGLAWWDPARCGTAGLQGTATVTHMYVIILISCLAIAVRNGWQELGNDGDGRRVLGVMVEAVLHAKGKIPDSMSYWLVCQTILVCVCVDTFLHFLFRGPYVVCNDILPGQCTLLPWMRAGSLVMIWAHHLEASLESHWLFSEELFVAWHGVMLTGIGWIDHPVSSVALSLWQQSSTWHENWLHFRWFIESTGQAWCLLPARSAVNVRPPSQCCSIVCFGKTMCQDFWFDSMVNWHLTLFNSMVQGRWWAACERGSWSVAEAVLESDIISFIVLAVHCVIRLPRPLNLHNLLPCPSKAMVDGSSGLSSVSHFIHWVSQSQSQHWQIWILSRQSQSWRWWFFSYFVLSLGRGVSTCSSVTGRSSGLSLVVSFQKKQFKVIRTMHSWLCSSFHLAFKMH